MKNHQHRNPADRRRGHDFDFGGFGPGFGPGFGGPRRRGRRPGRRGDVRAAALLLINEEPRHGYQLIQEISERSQGVWTPSPGSIYPVLSQLEDEGLIEFERVDGRKTATLTALGKRHVEEHLEELGSPWDEAREGVDVGDMRDFGQSLKGFVLAWRQVAQTGTPAQRQKAQEIIDDARRQLYGLLADPE